jgi:hypothetical protein
VPAADARSIADLLGLTDDELCDALGITPLEMLAGDADAIPATAILKDLLSEAEERAGAPLLKRWVRSRGPLGVPVEMLTSRNYAAFEDALGELAGRGFILRGGG